jgi:hypothetical protein
MAGASIGLATALHGTVADSSTSYRLGMILLLVGLAGIVEARVRINTYTLIEHQIDVARLSAQERQRFAEMGWRAAVLNAVPEQSNTAGGKVVDLPTRRTPEMRKGGSA